MTSDDRAQQDDAPDAPGSTRVLIWHGNGGIHPRLRAVLGRGAEDRGPLAWQRGDDGWHTRVDIGPLPRGTLLVPSLALRSRAPDAYAKRLVLGADSSDTDATLHLAPITVNGDHALLEHLPDATTTTVSSQLGQLEPGLDCVETLSDVHALRLEIRVCADEPPEVDLIVSHRLRFLDPASLDPRGRDGAVATSAHTLEVPRCSQMQCPPEIARQICSPTCVAMVLAHHDRPVSAEEMAYAVRHPQHRIFGMWPSNLAAAHRHGMTGIVRCFTSAREAIHVLDEGWPIITSIRFGAGELPGAALERTGGHLVILRGLEAHVAAINDPAAPTEADVPTTLPRDAFLKAWLGDRGVGYVLWPLDGDG